MTMIRSEDQSWTAPHHGAANPMKLYGSEAARRAQDVLPEDLRTNHCFNDLHHSTLVVLFTHALSSVREGNRKLVEYYLDNTTLYLLVHFLAEEEGMSHSVKKEMTELARASQHARIHLDLIDAWKDRVFIPFKSDRIDVQDLLDPLADYYQTVLGHIGEEDQGTYGTHSHLTEQNLRSEMAHVADTGLPLSPFMDGVAELITELCPEAGRLVCEHSWAPCARKPLHTLRLHEPLGLVDAVKGVALRDRLARHHS